MLFGRFRWRTGIAGAIGAFIVCVVLEYVIGARSCGGLDGEAPVAPIILTYGYWPAVLGVTILGFGLGAYTTSTRRLLYGLAIALAFGVALAIILVGPQSSPCTPM